MKIIREKYTRDQLSIISFLKFRSHLNNNNNNDIFFHGAKQHYQNIIVVSYHHHQFFALKIFQSRQVCPIRGVFLRWSDNRPVVYNYKSNRDRFNAISVPIKGKRRMNISLKITATREGGYRIFINRANGVDPCYAINVKRLYLSCNTSARKCRLFANCGECLRMQCFKRFPEDNRDFFKFEREFRMRRCTTKWIKNIGRSGNRSINLL